MNNKASITALMSSFGRAFHAENEEHPVFVDYFDSSVKSFFSWLGVIYYLSSEAIDTMLSALSRLSAEGSTLVFDYPDETFFDAPEKRVQNTIMMAKADSVLLLLCVVLCGLASMNFMTAPSVSLEGKSLWIMQSLPVEPWRIFRAKIRMQLLLIGLPLLLCIVHGTGWHIPGSQNADIDMDQRDRTY